MVVEARLPVRGVGPVIAAAAVWSTSPFSGDLHSRTVVLRCRLLEVGSAVWVPPVGYDVTSGSTRSGSAATSPRKRLISSSMSVSISTCCDLFALSLRFDLMMSCLRPRFLLFFGVSLFLSLVLLLFIVRLLSFRVWSFSSGLFDFIFRFRSPSHRLVPRLVDILPLNPLKFLLTCLCVCFVIVAVLVVEIVVVWRGFQILYVHVPMPASVRLF